MIEDIKKRLDETSATFNDLIDKAVTAYKDGVLEFFEVGNDGTSRYILATHNERDLLFHDGDSSYSYAVEYINSLYTETFVIESEEDIKRIEKDASVVLSNEMEVIASSDAFKIYNGWSVRFGEIKQGALMNFSFLKGATVTQKRGNQ